MKQWFFACALAMLLKDATAQNWSKDIAPILYQHCTACHHPGGLAPFSLLTWQEAQNYGSTIASATTTRAMPPWPPEAGYGSFAHDRALTVSEIQAISDWVQAGKPLGDTSNAPKPPSYNGGITITNPDLEVSIPAYTLKSSVDEYRCFPVKTNISNTEYITGIEVIPGNPEVVHHVLVFQDLSNTPFTLDAQDPDPGYTNFGGTGSSTSKLIGAWVPGMQPAFYPTGTGVKLPGNCNIVLQIHYPAGKQGKSDQTRVRFKLSSGSYREIAIDAALNHAAPVLQNGPLFIPANQTRTFIEKYTLPADVSILTVGPHMHLIGKSIKVYAVRPGNDTLPLIHITDWDFHWQGFYSLKKVTKLPKGTVLVAEAFYDNTTANPNNPNNPPQNVSLGEATTDEMMLVYFSYMLYRPGDENINLDTTFYQSGINMASMASYADMHCFPNPSNNQTELYIHATTSEKVTVSITDMKGTTVWNASEPYTLSAGSQSIMLPTESLPTGIYMVKIQGNILHKATLFIKR